MTPSTTQQLQAQLAELVEMNTQLQEQMKTIQFQNTQNETQSDLNPVQQSQMLKAKLKKPQVFDTLSDIRFWLMDIEDNIHEGHIMTETGKITYAISYLALIIWQRIQRLQLKQDDHVQLWPVLKVWLKDNYSCFNPTLKAELKLHNLHMWTNQSIIEFITEFEIIILNLDWNDAAVSSAFWQHLFSEIVQQIHNAYFNSWSETFTA